MSEAAFASWSLNPGWLLLLLPAAFFYFRGWWRLRRILPQRFPAWRMLCFIGGLLTLYAAVASPLDSFASLLLQAHMAQHLLLTMLAPPLLLLGSPLLPLLRGLPRNWAHAGVAPLLNWLPLKRIGRFLTWPPFALGIFMFSNIAWHIPSFYDAALSRNNVHEFEHACFFFTAVLFWWPVVAPWPFRESWPRWSMIPYLLLADLQNTLLAAFLTFYDGVIYETYRLAPRIFDVSAAADQAAAGVIMWVPGSMAYFIPAAFIAMKLLSVHKGVRPSEFFRPEKKTVLRGEGKVSARPFDLLAVPFFGSVLSSLTFRRSVQFLLFLIAVLLVVDGLFGPQISPLNLAGVLPWTYWRAFSIIALLVVGNIFCFGCPFILFRDGLRKIISPRLVWPRWLRLKWLVLFLLLFYLWAYESFALWDHPQLTAWLVIGYFTGSALIDSIFKGASFCKYVCPIGHFNFVQSLASPFQITTRSHDVCASCKTFDCIKGNEKSRGCELTLFQPRKQGNMDCTFCLDCVRACPHDNVGWVATSPSKNFLKVADNISESGIARLLQRRDILALCIVIVFAAFTNAAAMISPVLALEDYVMAGLGERMRLVLVAAFIFAGCILLPAILLGLTAWAAFGRKADLFKTEVLSFAYTLVPLGLGMWAAHFSFHFLTGLGTIVPVVQRFIGSSAESVWRPPIQLLEWLLPVELILLNAAFVSSTLLVWKFANRFIDNNKNISFWRVVTPWLLLAGGLFYLGVWILFQPMEMRGTLLK